MTGVPRESLSSKQERCKKIIKVLKKQYPDSKCSLDFKTPFQLMIATVLSAQCTDERVNQVTPLLFSRYKEPEDLMHAPIEDIEDIIRPTGFYKNKAKSLKANATVFVKEYKKEIPQSTDELSKFPGVGRKTANVVLGTAFGIPGMVVDTHVSRISNRLGFCKGSNAVKLERELMEIVEEKDWVCFTHLLIDHGRAICTARKAKCEDCFLSSYCPKKEYKK